jgi:hypothetical protein
MRRSRTYRLVRKAKPMPKPLSRRRAEKPGTELADWFFGEKKTIFSRVGSETVRELATEPSKS